MLIIPCHFKEYGTDILINNLKHLLPSKISHLIIVYSIQQGYTCDIEYIKEYIDNITDINVIFIHDVENRYIDWGKIVLAHKYIKENIIDINRVFVINDSIIICSDVTIYINNFVNNNHFEFIGFQESKQYITHYQSWFLIFDINVFVDWVTNIKILLPLVDVSDFVMNSILAIEVKLGNTFINKYKSTAICLVETKANPTHELDEILFNINKRDVHIFKYKCIISLESNKILYNLLPENLKKHF